jgi:glycosyltransferase involved in cell wall biosynthesis
MNANLQRTAAKLGEGGFAGKLGLQQRVLPSYRAAFFDTLASACAGGLDVFAGAPQAGESIQVACQLEVASLTLATNRHFGRVDSPYYFLRQPGLIPWLESWEPDVLIMEANSRYLSNRGAIHWMHAHGCPVIGWGLGAPPVTGRIFGSIMRRLRQSYLLSCDALIAYSQRGAQEFRRLGVPANRVFVATNAVAPPPAAPPAERPPDYTGQPVVLFIGRLQGRKRIDNLLRACASLPASLQPRLILVGDGPEREELEKLAREIYPAAEFPGSKRAGELEPYFQDADLFVLPGTGGLAVQEAMAHGLPVLVAEADGTQGDMVKPENGWLIPPGDLEALQSSLQHALSDPRQLRRMGFQSYRIVAQEVNIQSMAQVFLSAIEAVQPLTRE